MLQALRGILRCHGRNYVHRNLNPNSLRFDAHGTLKISKFGYAVKARGFLTEYPNFMVCPAFLFFHPNNFILTLNVVLSIGKNSEI